MTETQAQFIDVEELRVGMYVYLDLGWMGHPFASNSFKIGSNSQIETIRGLGLKRLRWSPEKSDPADTTSTAIAVEASQKTPSSLEQRRRLLLAQRTSLEHCDREFSDATRAFHDILKLAQAQPEPARECAETLIDHLVEQLLDQGESLIRLLSEKAGEPSSIHAINVTVISLLLGKRLGLDAETLTHLGLGALLHDVGKMRLPERLRWRDNTTNSAEHRLFQQHVDHGVELAIRMGLEEKTCAIIAQHHEYVDGSGFPQRLTGDAMKEMARIVALINHYDNLCNPANPVAAMTPHNALSLIFAHSKQKFDVHILGSFIRMMGVYPPGSIVSLTDGRYALVVSVSAARPLKPRVLIHDPRIPRDDALVIDLEAHADLGIRESLKPVQLPRAVFDYLSPRQRMCYFFERARDGIGPQEGQ